MATTTPALTAVPSPTWPSNVFPSQLTPAATCGFGTDLWLATLDCALYNIGTVSSGVNRPSSTGQPDWFTCSPVVNAGRPLVHFTSSGPESALITTATPALEDDCYQNRYGTWGASTQTTDGKTNTHYFATCPVGLSFGLVSTKTEDILFKTTHSGSSYGGWTINMPACTAKVTAGQVVTVTDTLTGGNSVTTTTTSLEADATIFAEVQTLKYTVFADQHTCFRDCGKLYESPGVSEWLSQYTPTGTQSTESPTPTGGEGTEPEGQEEGSETDDAEEPAATTEPSGAGQTAGFKVGILGAALAVAVGVVAGL